MTAPHASVSIVCVYNDVAVRQECLDRSIQALCSEASDLEYLPIDNVHGSYPTAGAALNYGVSQAKNDVVAFVHQDVFLHSLVALKEAAGHMSADGFGLLGAVGVSAEGRTVGRIRDRVVLLGEAVARTTDVDSLDEVLFMAPRSQLLRDPLTESPDMAWHAYAVEYGLRVRKRGLRTGVADIPLTHNSLSTNLDRLDVAHRAIAARYTDMLPVRTTCGVITERITRSGRRPWFPSHRWRYRWLLESLALWRARAARPEAAVLADIRRNVDRLLEHAPGRRLHIVNRAQGRFMDGGPAALELARRDGSVVIAAGDVSDFRAAVAARPIGTWLLLTNLSRADLAMLSAGPSVPSPSVLGFHAGIGFWLLFGAPCADLPPQWHAKRATPLGIKSLVAESGT